MIPNNIPDKMPGVEGVDYLQPPPANKGQVIRDLPQEGGALELKDSPSNLKAIHKLVDGWQDKQEPQLSLDGHLKKVPLCFYGKPIAQVVFNIDGDRGETSAIVYLLPILENPKAVKDFAKTIMENLERLGLEYPNLAITP